MLEDAVLDESEADEEDAEDEEGHARADQREAAGIFFLASNIVPEIPQLFHDRIAEQAEKDL